MRQWRSQRPSRNTSTSRSQQCSGTVPVPGCIPNEIPEGRLGRVQTQAGPAGSGSGAGQTGGQCPSGHHDQNFYWQKTRICGRAQITHLEWMTRRSGKKSIRPAKRRTGKLLPRHDIGPEVELPVHSHAPQRAMARLVAIQGDALWLPMMLQCLAKEGLRRRNAACSTQTELHGVALSVHGSIQVHQLAPNRDERFINSPAPTHLSLESAPPLFASFGIANDPTQDRGVRNR